MDTFPQQGHRAFRLAASLHTLEIKKHMGAARTTPTPAAASSSAGHLPASTRSGSSSAGTSPGKLRTLQHSQEWRELLGYHAALGRSRGPEACMVAVMVEAVRPDLEEGEARTVPVPVCAACADVLLWGTRLPGIHPELSGIDSGFSFILESQGHGSA